MALTAGPGAELPGTCLAGDTGASLPAGLVRLRGGGRVSWLWPLSFERGQPEFELIDTVPEDLELRLVGQAPFGGFAQARRGLGARGDQSERHESLRPVRTA